MRPGERQRVLRVVVLKAVRFLRGHVGEGVVRWAPASPVRRETGVTAKSCVARERRRPRAA